MKKVLYSTHPKWVYKILIGTKLIEVRKTIPKIELPFEGYIYCTKDNTLVISMGPFGPAMLDFEDEYVMNGKIVAKFICNKIETYQWLPQENRYSIDDDTLALTCLQRDDFNSYGKGKPLYGIYIDSIVPFEQPLQINRAMVECSNKERDPMICDNCPYDVVIRHPEWEDDYCATDGHKYLTRPPQSWGYIKEIVNEEDAYSTITNINREVSVEITYR